MDLSSSHSIREGIRQTLLQKKSKRACNDAEVVGLAGLLLITALSLSFA